MMIQKSFALAGLAASAAAVFALDPSPPSGAVGRMGLPSVLASGARGG